MAAAKPSYPMETRTKVIMSTTSDMALALISSKLEPNMLVITLRTRSMAKEHFIIPMARSMKVLGPKMYVMATVNTHTQTATHMKVAG